MKAKEKRMILVLVLITIVVIIVAVTRNGGDENKTVTEEKENIVVEEFVEVLEDGTALNTSEELHKTKKFEGMEISEFQLTEKDNVTLLLGTVTNTSSTVQGGYPIDIKVLDKEGKEIITIGAYIGELQPGASTQLSTSATFDYANAYDFEISKAAMPEPVEETPAEPAATE